MAFFCIFHRSTYIASNGIRILLNTRLQTSLYFQKSYSSRISNFTFPLTNLWCLSPGRLSWHNGAKFINRAIKTESQRATFYTAVWGEERRVPKTLLSTLGRRLYDVLIVRNVFQLIVIVEWFQVKLDYRSSLKCPWIYCSSEWFFNTKYDTHKIWPFENMI